MSEGYLFKMMEFVFESGQIALKNFGDGRSELKKDNSVITDTDKEVSDLVHEKLGDFLEDKDHVLIEEEDPEKERYFDNEEINNKPFIWAVDPIDGTRLFANNIPLYGISIGLIKEQKPWMGVVYFPSLKEIFYCDGNNAYFVSNAFSTNEKKVKIVPLEPEISNRSLFLLTDNFFKFFNWTSDDCRIFMSGCATINLCWPAISRGCGTLDQSHIWDFAGSWPIFMKAGMDLRNIDTGEKLNHFNLRFFSKDVRSWHLNNFYVLSSEKNFDILKQKVSRK